MAEYWSEWPPQHEVVLAIGIFLGALKMPKKIRRPTDADVIKTSAEFAREFNIDRMPDILTPAPMSEAPEWLREFLLNPPAPGQTFDDQGFIPVMPVN